MRKQYSRIAAIVMAVTAGGLAALALKPAPGNSAATLAARNPAVEVRTQVIRRTIHVIRHEPGARLRGHRGSAAVLGAAESHARARTSASGAHRAGHAAGTGVAVATRTSGSHSTPSSPTNQSHPVATRSSGSHSTASAPTHRSQPVSTRSSGSLGTSSGAASAGSSGRPVTRASGGGHGHGDGGDDGGHDD
jgi:hypothetical protein